MLKRILLSVFAAVVAFIAVFLAIFVPLLLWDMHVAPNDGQGGMGGFFLGVPVALLAALAAGAAMFNRSLRRRRFKPASGANEEEELHQQDVQ